MEIIKLLSICMCLLGWCLSQKVIKQATLDDPLVVLELSLNETSDDCLKQMQGILTPGQVNDLSSMVVKSGKGINQLGLYEGCNEEKNLKFAVAVVRGKETNLGYLTLGLCVPKQCDSNSLKPITDIMVQAVSRVFADPIFGSIEFPNQVMSSGPDTKAWIMITFIILFVALCIFGIVVEFTSFGDRSRFTEDERQLLKVEDRKSKLGLALYSFSPINNVKKLFTVSKKGDQSLAVLNGVRVLSIGWVVVGHSFNFALITPTVNLTNLSILYKGTLFGIIPAGVFAVDTFFFLSGLLTCSLLAIKMYPKKGATNFFLVYFHRYYRLIFPLLFMQGFAVCLARYLGDGPIYRQTWDAFLMPCNKYWWSNLLFINNLVPWKMNDECIGWVWYLANDFQFFLVTPPILYVFCKNRKVGYALFCLLLLGSMLYNGILFGVYNISIINNSKEIDVMSLMYIKPWSRIGAYIIGCLFGLGIFELKMKEKHPELKNTLSNLFFIKLQNSRVLSIACAVIGTGLTALYVFPIGDAYANCKDSNCWPLFFSSLYGATFRPFFVLGVGLIIAPTIVGRLRFLINFLGSEAFTVLARLNYSVYLWHIVVMWWVLMDLRQGNYASLLNQWFFGIGATVITFLVAIPASMISEVPFMNLEKYVLFPEKKKDLVKQKAKDQREFSQLKPLIKQDEESNHANDKTMASAKE